MIVLAVLSPVPVFIGAALLLGVAIASFVFFMRVNKSRKQAFDRKLDEYNKAVEELKKRDAEQQQRAAELKKKSDEKPAAPKPVVKTAVVKEDQLPRRVQFMAPNGASYDIPMKDSFTIGKSPKCDFVVKNGTIGDVHCRVLYVDGKYRIEDLGNAGGVAFDGNQVPKNSSMEIKTGLLQIGRVTFFVTIDAEDKAG